MSLAAQTREAVRTRPFLLAGLRAGIVNYAAAARTIDVAEDTEAVATALRRFAERLPALETESRSARVTMHGGVRAAKGAGADDPLLSVGGVDYGAGAGTGDGDGEGEDDGDGNHGDRDGDGDHGDGDGDGDRGRDDGDRAGDHGDRGPDRGDPRTAVLARGDVDAATLAHVLGVLSAHGIDPEAAATGGDALVVVVPRRHGPEAVRRIEEALSAVPVTAKTTV